MLLFVPNESTKDGKHKSAITKGTKGAECGKEGSMLYHSLSQLAKDRLGDIYLNFYSVPSWDILGLQGLSNDHGPHQVRHYYANKRTTGGSSGPQIP